MAKLCGLLFVVVLHINNFIEKSEWLMIVEEAIDTRVSIQCLYKEHFQ